MGGCCSGVQVGLLSIAFVISGKSSFCCVWIVFDIFDAESLWKCLVLAMFMILDFLLCIFISESCRTDGWRRGGDGGVGWESLSLGR